MSQPDHEDVVVLVDGVQKGTINAHIPSGGLLFAASSPDASQSVDADFFHVKFSR